MLVPEAPAPGTGCAQPSAGCCTATPACMRAMWSSGSGCRCVRRKSYSSSARICCCPPVELALRCRCSCCCLVLSIDGPHLIQDRLQDCLVSSALCYPTSWINVQEVLPDAGSTTYKDMLAVLALHLLLVRLSFSSMTLTRFHSFPFSLGILNIFVHVRLYRGGYR